MKCRWVTRENLCELQHLLYGNFGAKNAAFVGGKVFHGESFDPKLHDVVDEGDGKSSTLAQHHYPVNQTHPHIKNTRLSAS